MGHSETLRAVTGVFSVMAVGDKGTLLSSNSLAMTWTPRNSGVTSTLRGLPMFLSGGFVVGDSGLILTTTNGGLSWATRPSGTTHGLRSIQFSTNNTSRAYIVGNGGTILKTTDNGQTWGFQQSNITRNLRSTFFYLSDNNGFAVGDSGTILRTTDGGGPIIFTSVTERGEQHTGFRLQQNYPNPFNQRTVIRFNVGTYGHTSLRVFDMLGREVATLVNERLDAGQHERIFDGKGLTSGVYFYRLKSGEFTETKKLLLAK
ncbi:MAG: YCF48-related protein [Bacteroidota bacterium]